MDIYILNINNLNEDDIKLVEKNLPKRYERASKFHFRKDFLLSIGAGILLIKYLGITDESLFLYNEHQKPYLKTETHFNISHSGNYVVLVKHNEYIGIDIEIIDDFSKNVSKKIYQEDEIFWMKSDESNRFFVLWTQKESVMKLLGTRFELSS